ARHDEVVLVQSLDLLSAQRDGRVTPAEVDIGVMAFGLGQLADALHEGERLPEIAESKRALDAVGVIAQRPVRSLLLEMERFVACKRRNTAATRRAGFFREGLGHAVCGGSNLCGTGTAAAGTRAPQKASLSLAKDARADSLEVDVLGSTPPLPPAAVGGKACLMARAGDHAVAPARLAISASIQA